MTSPPKGTTSPGEAKGRATLLARRIVCRALDIDPELPSAAVDDIFAAGNVRGEFAVLEAAQALADAEQHGKEQSAQLRQDGQGWVSADVEMLLSAARRVLNANANVPPVGLSRDQMEHDAMRELIEAVDRFPHPCAATVPSPPSGGG